MIPQSTDTNIEVEKQLLKKIRSMTDSERLFKALKLSDFVMRQSKRAIDEANPDLSEFEKKLIFISVHYGEEVADRVSKSLVLKNE